VKRFKMPERIALAAAPGVEVSTVQLNSVGQGYETCVFYSNGDSRVVGTYDTRDEAIQGHRKVVESIHRVRDYV